MPARDAGMVLMAVMWLLAGVSWLMADWCAEVLHDLPFLQDAHSSVMLQVQAANRWHCVRYYWERTGALPSTCLSKGWDLTVEEAAPGATSRSLVLSHGAARWYYAVVQTVSQEDVSSRSAYVCGEHAC